MKRLISMILAIAMSFGMLPVGEMVAFAAGDPLNVTGIYIKTDYDGVPGKNKSLELRIVGQGLENNLRNIRLGLKKGGKKSEDYIDDINDYEVIYKIEDGKFDDRVIINGETINIEIGVPDVTGMEPSGGIILKSSDVMEDNRDVILKGSDFPKEFNKGNSKAAFKKSDSPDVFIKRKYGSGKKADEVTTDVLKKQTGSWDLYFSNTERIVVGATINNIKRVDINIENNYRNAVNIIGELDVEEPFKINPNIGLPKDDVEITGKKLQNKDNMSVFFVKNEQQLFADDAMKYEADYYDYESNDGEDIARIKVPDIPIDDYKVFLTSKIPEAKDIPKGESHKDYMKSRKYVGDFTVIGNSMKITSVNPREEIYSGRELTLKGNYIASLSELFNMKNKNIGLEDIEYEISSDGKKLKVKYGEDVEETPIPDEIGTFDGIKDLDGDPIYYIEKEIEVFIGESNSRRATFKDIKSLDSKKEDVLTIEATDNDNIEEQVRVEVKTKVKYIDKEDRDKEDRDKKIKEREWTERDIWNKTLKYKEALGPTIDIIKPDTIFVDENNKISSDYTITIIGKNFDVHRYVGNDGKFKYKKPKISIEGYEEEIKDIKVYDENNKIVDGLDINGSKGTKIVFKIPKGYEMKENITEDGNNRAITVINPYISDDDKGEGKSTSSIITFKKEDDKRKPNIDDTYPRIFNSEGTKNAKIIGKNFKDYGEANVIISDELESELEEINGRKVEDDKNITFDAPKREKGTYKIIVQNEYGRAEKEIEYESVPAPSITRFDPKKGYKGTEVTVEGTNFFAPDLSVADEDDSKLIGTTIRLDEKDVNIYNGKNREEAKFQTFINGEDILTVKDGKVITSNYYHSILLRDKENNKYYRIVEDEGDNKEVKILDENDKLYNLSVDDKGKIIIFGENGESKKVEVKNDSLKIGGILGEKLEYITPYKVEDNIIVGNRVKVIYNSNMMDKSSNKLIFEVPDLGYDKSKEVNLDVVNPNGEEIRAKDKFLYEVKKPEGLEIHPNTGSIEGREIRNIIGKNFIESKISLYDKTNDQLKEEFLQLVKIDYQGIEKESSIKDKGNTVVNLTKNEEVSNVYIEYNKEKQEIKLNAYVGEDNNKRYELKVNIDSDDEEAYRNGVFFDINSLENNKGEKYLEEYEYIRVKLKDGKLIVDRGFSPNAKLVDDIIVVDMPSYLINKDEETVDIVVINPEGQEGTVKYTYQSQPPIIHDISEINGKGERIDDKKKTIELHYNGNQTMVVEGDSFVGDIRLEILNQNNGKLEVVGAPIDIKEEDIISNKIYFHMPKMEKGKTYILKIINNYVNDEIHGSSKLSTDLKESKYESIYIEAIDEGKSSIIEEIKPNKGPSEGGTEVTIKGHRFSENSIVMFGKEKAEIKNVNEAKKEMIVISPPHKPGEVEVKVQIGTNTAVVEGDNKFTYTSNPKITKIVDPLNGDTIKPSLSIEGGETIKIVGNDFMNNPTDPRVIFNPILKEANKNPDVQGERIFINGVEYILESGTPGTDVEYIDSENIKVKTPRGTLDTGGVIVINPDGAGTPIYDINYVIPEISHPQDVRATLIKDEYIRINWNEVVDKATEDDGKKVQYEVYMLDGTQREFLGSTATTGFVFRDIKPNTTYKFLIRAVGKYGSSKPLDESMSNEVRTGSTAGPVDQDGQPGENTTVDKTGDTAKVVIGEDAFSQGNEYVIDLTRGTLSGSKDLVMSMSAKTVVNGRSRTVKIIGSDFNLSFSPNVFENSTLRNNKNKTSAGVKFEVSPTDGRFELTNNRGETILSSNYLLEAKAFVGASSESLDNLNGKMNLVLDYDQDLVRRRRIKESNINLVKYDVYERRFKEVFGSRSSYGTSIGDIDELGTYTITGSRR